MRVASAGWTQRTSAGVTRASLSWIALMIAFPSAVAPQDTLPLAAGDRIRLSAYESPTAAVECTGRYMGVRRDTLIAQCRPSGRKTWDEMRVPLESLTSLEFSQGKKSNVGKGALIGALVGAGFGLALGIAVAVEEDSGWFDYGAEVIPVSMLGGAFWGTAFGLVIGALTPGEQWAEVPIDSIRPSPSTVAMSGIGLRVSVPVP